MKDQDKDIVLTLLSDERFKDWVMVPSSETDAYWQEWMYAEPNRKEAVAQAKSIVKGIRFEEAYLETTEIESMLSNIMDERHQESGRFKVERTRNWNSVYRGIAAAVVILIAATLVFTDAFNNVESIFLNGNEVTLHEVSNPKGMRSKVTLPDGSIVSLNANSVLKYPEQFSDKQRIVELSGEAFFDVVKNPDKPFIVRTNKLETVVLGTSFNVRYFDDEEAINVALVSGKVNVVERTEGKSKQQILLPGEKLVYDKAGKSFSKGTFDYDEEVGWKDGVLAFKDADFQSVINQLELWYGVEIKVLGVPSSEWKVNGKFDKESVEEVLVGLQFTYGINYQIDGNNITVSCN
ncbi:FecR domain-containing protein [Limibacter armeniacum]|uniref:FecR family protein n=1 Tax=Limibacter armeniacum TaxID=466084 RepID=UPI002FE54FF8